MLVGFQFDVLTYSCMYRPNVATHGHTHVNCVEAKEGNFMFNVLDRFDPIQWNWIVPTKHAVHIYFTSPKRSLLLLIDVQYQWCFHPSHCFFSVCFYPLVSTNVNVAESMHSLVQVKSNMNGCVWEFNDRMGPTVYNKYLNPLPCVLCVNGCYTTVYLASILNQT